MVDGGWWVGVGVGVVGGGGGGGCSDQVVVVGGDSGGWWRWGVVAVVAFCGSLLGGRSCVLTSN